jgi:hypothetical protein
VAAIPPSVVALNALALIASELPGLNPPFPIYAILMSDTFLPLTIPSSWGEFSPRWDTQTSDYPQERGAFQPYNIVSRPTAVNVMLIKTGSDVARFAWFAAIQQIKAVLPNQLYTLVSPDGVYTDYALSGMSKETRPDRGTNILYLNLSFTQIPQITLTDGTSGDTVAPKSGPVEQIGQLFTNAVSTAQTNLITAQTLITGG